jgi:intracellular multiplication protein IcmK
MDIRSALAVLACCALAGPALAQGGPDPAAADASYGAARGREFRLSPQMIEDLAKRYDEDQRARARVGSSATFVSPITRRIDVKFTPGDAVPIVEASLTYPTVLSFFDSSGQPWPVVRDQNSNPKGEGNTGGFEVTRPIEGGNTVEITVTSQFPRGGLVVYLRGAPKPISFMLVSGRGRYDANASVFIADRGPNALSPVVVRREVPDTGDEEMGKMLDGITPAGARSLTIVNGSPDEYRAWRIRNLVYLRTTQMLMLPEPVAYKMAEGGLRLYAVPVGNAGDTSFLLSDGSQNFRLRTREQ